MRVVCIDQNSSYQDTVTRIIKGNVYTVIDSSEVNDYRPDGNKVMDGVYYKLLETGYWYHSSLFVQINEDQQDEMELLEQRQQQYA